MKKRSKLIATLVASIMCLSLIVYGVYAFTATFALNSSFSFEANGVYVGISGQVYTGASASELSALTTEGKNYTLAETKNFTAKEDGTPDGSKANEAISAWEPANVALNESTPVLVYEISFKNYSPYFISVEITNSTTEVENVEMAEDKAGVEMIGSGETGVYKFTIEVKNLLASIAETPVIMAFNINKLDVTIDENWFNVSSDGQLTGFNATYYNDTTAPEILVIPETIKGIQVKSLQIGTEVGRFTPTLYTSAYKLSSATKKLIIKAQITSIPDGCFASCKNLTSIILPESLTTIGYEAFYECDGLTSITIPSKVSSIGDAAFGNASTLVSVFMEGSCPTIEADTFGGQLLGMPYNNTNFAIYVKAAHLASYQSTTNNWQYYQSKLKTY